MKRLFAILLALVSSTALWAHAYSANSSWEEILSAKYLDVQAPTVWMGRSIDYTFVCQNGDHLRTMKPVDITETRSRGDRMEVVVVGHEYLSTPINYVHTIEDCTYFGERSYCRDRQVTGSYPLTVVIPVYRHISNRNADHWQLLFRKSYTVPPCESIQPR